MVQMAFRDFGDLSHTYQQVTNVCPVCFCHPTVGNFDVSPNRHTFLFSTARTAVVTVRFPSAAARGRRNTSPNVSGHSNYSAPASSAHNNGPRVATLLLIYQRNYFDIVLGEWIVETSIVRPRDVTSDTLLGFPTFLVITIYSWKKSHVTAIYPHFSISV